MKLLSLRLCNFRQFYGKTPEIILATGPNKNTTIIHGNNGSGKTGLLNAFTWVLYEKFTAAFAAESQLVNKRAIAEANEGQAIDCWVELQWEHDTKRYLLKRNCRAYKSGNNIAIGKTELYMQVANEDGKWYHPQQHPSDIISEILPASLHQYFFFDGERIEKIVRSDKKNEIAEGIKMLLGVEIINRAITHLKEAKKTLENELKNIGDPQTKELISNQQKIEQQIENINQRQAEIVKEIENQNIIKNETNNRFRELSAVKELAETRQQLDKKRSIHQEQIKKSREIIKKNIGNKGYIIVMLSFKEEFDRIIQTLKQKGQLKIGVSPDFIQTILNNQQCICGTPLEPGTNHHQEVNLWLQRAGMSAIEQNAFQLHDRFQEIITEVDPFWETINQEQHRIEEHRKELSEVEQQLDKIESKLRKDPSEEIRNLQNRLDNIETRIREMTLEQGANLQKITDLNTQLQEIVKQISKQKINEQKQKLTQKRIIGTTDAIERLIEVRKRREHQFRLELENQVKQIFKQISFTPYEPQISDKYELNLVENSQGIETVVAASTGENQILSLSFLGGIIERVREWSKKKMLMIPNSSDFPIVMDSPFGSLDEIYRRQIAKIIPKLANQLIVLLTKTQWRQEVEEEIQHRIARQYILTYYSSKPDCELDSLEIDGISYPLVKQSPNQYDYTEIIEIDYGF